MFIVDSLTKALVENLNSPVDYSRGEFSRYTTEEIEEAKAEIMSTFVAETKKKRVLLQQAFEQRDMATITTVTHQLLPLFVMVGATGGKENLEWFEARRDITVYPDDADARIADILVDIDFIISEAEKEFTK